MTNELELSEIPQKMSPRRYASYLRSHTTPKVSELFPDYEREWSEEYIKEVYFEIKKFSSKTKTKKQTHKLRLLMVRFMALLPYSDFIKVLRHNLWIKSKYKGIHYFPLLISRLPTPTLVALLTSSDVDTPQLKQFYRIILDNIVPEELSEFDKSKLQVFMDLYISRNKYMFKHLIKYLVRIFSGDEYLFEFIAGHVKYEYFFEITLEMMKHLNPSEDICQKIYTLAINHPACDDSAANGLTELYLLLLEDNDTSVSDLFVNLFPLLETSLSPFNMEQVLNHIEPKSLNLLLLRASDENVKKQIFSKKKIRGE